MSPSPLFVAFLLASLVLAATPGPGVVYVVTRTLAQGRRAGLASVAGVAIGNLGNAVGAALGLAALFAVSALAFEVVRYAGAAYLVWLGWRTLQSPVAPATEGAAAMPAMPPARILRDGAVVSLLNPKTTLFFAAFLPQFIEPGGSAVLQSVGLGAVFVLIAACTDLLYVLGAGMVAPGLVRRPQGLPIGRWLSAAIYVGLGLYTAAMGERPRR
ncbi:MAG: LysE family translocator [Ideonella sp.]|nr:LysE family translocator [Ideonella sp.]